MKTVLIIKKIAITLLIAYGLYIAVTDTKNKIDGIGVFFITAGIILLAGGLFPKWYKRKKDSDNNPVNDENSNEIK